MEASNPFNGINAEASDSPFTGAAQRRAYFEVQRHIEVFGMHSEETLAKMNETFANENLFTVVDHTSRSPAAFTIAPYFLKPRAFEEFTVPHIPSPEGPAHQRDKELFKQAQDLLDIILPLQAAFISLTNPGVNAPEYAVEMLDHLLVETKRRFKFLHPSVSLNSKRPPQFSTSFNEPKLVFTRAIPKMNTNGRV